MSKLKPKTSTQYICQSCGAVHAKWSGQCSDCGAWNSIVAESVSSNATGMNIAQKGRLANTVQLESLVDTGLYPDVTQFRKYTGIAEFDRVTGGGLVEGSAILIGGDPGIGKSTLLLQVLGQLAVKHSCLYISGEESVAQVRGRASRLGLSGIPLTLATHTNVRDILKTLKDLQLGSANKGLEVLVIDSIQTMYVEALDAAPGTVSQVRSSAMELISAAKTMGFCLILVGHVTKDGQIAGPRVLEHMVDTVLYFEGDQNHQYRLLRAVKNRFGAAGEIGVFEMAGEGLVPVANPSALFLTEREHPIAGTAVFAGMEGTRPLLVEVQALIAPSTYAAPKRAAIGWDNNRLSMLLAVLEARAGIQIGHQDIFLNIAGGFRIQEPAADLAVAMALLSAHLNKPLSGLPVCFGEIGLTGEIRAVPQPDARLKEAAHLGFTSAYIARGSTQTPSGGSTQNSPKNASATATRVLKHVSELVEVFQDG